MMTGRVYPTTREALHYTVRDFCGRDSEKTLILLKALNCAASTLSAITALYPSESTRNPSPEQIDIIIEVTQDDSIIRTQASRAGYDSDSLRPKMDNLPAIVQRLVERQERMQEEGREIQKAVQLVLSVPLVSQGKKR